MPHSLVAPFTGEFLGTLVLVLLGNGVVSAVNLKRSKGEGGGWIAITTGWGIAVFAAVITARAWGSPQAHINPAVTLSQAILTGDYHRIPIFLPAQILGAMTGALLVWLAYLPHWGLTDDAGVKHACFCTSPAVRSYAANFMTECIGTAMLVLLIAALASQIGMPYGMPNGLGPLLVGYAVWGIGLSLGGPTGYAINPARDLGPRVMYSLLPIPGKGSSDWAYAWVPVFGPLTGAAFAACVIRCFGAM